MSDGVVLRQKIRRPVQWIAITLTLFQLYVASGATVLQLMTLRGTHLAFILTLCFLVTPTRGDQREHPAFFFLDVLLALAGIVVNAYVVLLNQFYPEVVASSGGLASNLEITLGLITILLVLEAARRLMGPILPLICLFFIVHALFSNLFPGILYGRGYSLSRVMGTMYLWTSGIYGIALGIAANEVFLFIVFAAFFAASGVGEMMMKVVTGFFGSVRGGPAKVAIVASSFFGTLSGAAVANVMTTGAVSIPMMKRLGYKPEFAGAVEAVASTGGMFTPPVMGAAAFIMAEYLQIPYGEVILAAAIPAFLYYLGLYFAIDFEAVKTGLVGLAREHLPDPWQALRNGWHLVLPLILLVYLLVGLQFTPAKAGFYSIIAILIVSSFRKETRMKFGQILKALEDSAMNAVQVSVATAAVGLIIGSVTLTGLGINLSSGLVALSGGNLPILLILTMVVSIILGLGVTVTVIYITLAVLVAPTLVQMGVEPIAAHMFVLYYGILGMITPPVALAAFAAASIANTSPMRTGFVAWRLGLTAFILPFMWVYGPSLLWQGTLPEIIETTITSAVGVYAFAAGLQGWLLRYTSLWERFVLLAAALLLIKPGILTDLPGIVLLAIVLANQWWSMRRRPVEDLRGVVEG